MLDIKKKLEEVKREKELEREKQRQQEKQEQIEFFKKNWKILLVACIALIIIISFGVWSEKKEQKDVNKIAINSTSSEFEGKNYKDVVNQLKKAGFTNVKTKVLDDLVIGFMKKDGEVKQVDINGITEFSKNTSFPKDAKIVITYHTFPKEKNDEDAKSNLEINFPVENAKRSAVVAITNWYAVDVFKEDGSTYDISKFHSYSDTSGKVESYFLNVTSWGTWSVKDGEVWHVDSLKLKNSLGVVIEGSLDVKFDQKNYIISNVNGKLGTDTDLSQMETSNNSSIFITVSPEMIKNDRKQSEVDALDHSGDLDKYAARTAFEKNGKQQYPYGFKCHWIVGLINEEQAGDGSWFFKVDVTITNQYGTDKDTVAEGKIGGTTDNPIINDFHVS